MNIFTKLTVVLLLAAGGISTASAQLLKKIGTNPFTINRSAALEIESTTKGFLPPRMDTAARGNLVAPATGLIIYNTTTNSMEVNTGSSNNPTWKATLAANPAVKTIVSNYTMTADDYTVLVEVTNSFYAADALYLTLPIGPAAVAANIKVGKIFIVGKIDDTDNKVAFFPRLILNKSVVGTLNYPKLFRIQYDGTDWQVID